jgi:8-oxo-dGTP pyrophosphatase MutT (NUDIX family)
MLFAAARVWWFIRRPHTYGSVVAIWHENRVLIVQSSYRRHFGFPGGFQKRGETTLETATREVFEELRLTISPAALTLAWEGSTAFEHRRDTTTIWKTAFDVPPVIRLDGREIVAAMWKTPDEARALLLTPPVAAYLERL